MRIIYPNHEMSKRENFYSEDLSLDYNSLTELSYFDDGENEIELYHGETFVGYLEVWTDMGTEEEYIIINHEIIYLNQITLEQNKIQTKMETRVFLVSVNAEILDTVNHKTLSDNEFMGLSEKEGTVYTLKGFQNALNSQEINMENYWVRIIEVNKPTSVWDFVEQNLPNYNQSDEVAESDDLDKIIYNEYEEGDHADRLRQEIIEEIGTDDPLLIKQKAEQKLHEVNAYLFEESIKNFLKID